MPSADGLGWPAGKPLAISLSVMLEGWAEGSAPGIGPMGNPLKPGVADLHALSWAEFGPKVGALRLLLPATRQSWHKSGQITSPPVLGMSSGAFAELCGGPATQPPQRPNPLS
jgi:hypothetical protein